MDVAATTLDRYALLFPMAEASEITVGFLAWGEGRFSDMTYSAVVTNRLHLVCLLVAGCSRETMPEAPVQASSGVKPLHSTHIPASTTISLFGVLLA